VVANNVISNTTRSGVHVNRINGEPKEVLIVNNNISETPFGVYITGDTGGVTVSSNVISSFNLAGLKLGSGSGNVSKVIIRDNFFKPDSPDAPLIHIQALTASFNRGTDNYYEYQNFPKSKLFVNDSKNSHLNIFHGFQNIYDPQNFKSSSGQRLIKTTNRHKHLDIPVSSNTGGKISIFATSGGGWQTFYEGRFVVANGNIHVEEDVNMSKFQHGSIVNKISGENSLGVIRIHFRNTGADIIAKWKIEQF